LTVPDIRRIGVSASTSLQQSQFLEASENATDSRATIRRIRERVAATFRRAFREEFREGTTSDFALDIQSLVLDFGAPALIELRTFLMSEALPVGIGFETLTTIAELKSAAGSAAADRSSLIEWALTSRSAEMRYGAAFALAALKDKGSVKALEAAIARETIPEVRKAQERVLRAIQGD
jgi:hypothetical protein